MRGRRQEQALLRGLEQDPALEELALEGGEGAVLDDLDRLPVGARWVSGEPQLEERARAAPARLHVCGAHDLDQPICEPAAARLELLVEPVLPRLGHRRDDGGARDGVRVVGASVHGAALADDGHRLARAAHRRDGEAAADRLGQDRQVGLDAEETLGALATRAEAGQHLVEDQERTGVARQHPPAREVAGGGEDAPAVAHDGLGDHGCDQPNLIKM